MNNIIEREKVAFSYHEGIIFACMFPFLFLKDEKSSTLLDIHFLSSLDFGSHALHGSRHVGVVLH